MEKLSEVKQALKYLEIDAKAYADNFSASMIVSTKNILAIAEAFRALDQEVQKNLDGALAWQQRAEAAEAKLAELAQQKPIGWLNDAYLGRGVIDGEVGQDDFGPGYIPIYSHPFNDAPAPAADLADLVPDAKAIRKEAGGYAPVYSLQEQQLFIDGATWLRAAILLNIEEMSK